MRIIRPRSLTSDTSDGLEGALESFIASRRLEEVAKSQVRAERDGFDVFLSHATTDARIVLEFDRSEGGFDYWRAPTGTFTLGNGISTLQVRALQP